MNSDSLLSGDNAAFIDQQYQMWLNDAASVEPAWAQLFSSWDPGEEEPTGSGATFATGPSFTPRSIFEPSGASAPAVSLTNNTAELEMRSASKQARVAQLVNAYRVRGHLMAKVDPLGLREQL
ncbi:MAG: hypothetical protein AB8H79_01640, partial [Myxococcota bacterium]